MKTFCGCCAKGANCPLQYDEERRAKLSGSKASAYEREHEFELRKYRQADEALNRWEADGERLDYKGWQTAMKHIDSTLAMANGAAIPMISTIQAATSISRGTILFM